MKYGYLYNNTYFVITCKFIIPVVYPKFIYHNTFWSYVKGISRFTFHIRPKRIRSIPQNLQNIFPFLGIEPKNLR